MKIAIDVSPLESGHKVRGVGFYLQHLKDALVRYFPQQDFLFFNESALIPQEADIVHYPYLDPFFFTLPLKKRKKTIVTVHDLTPLVLPELFPSGLKGRLRWLAQRQRLRSVDAIVTDSESSKHDIVRYTGISDKKIAVVYLAAGEEFTEKKYEKDEGQKIRKKYNLPEKFALYVGDVTANKNLPRLVRACLFIDVPLVMVGKALTETEYDRSNPWNADRQTVEALTENSPLVTKLGFIPTEDLTVLYRTATVFVMPSLYEGFGLPILEAMASGTPVVTARAGSLKEVAGEAAIFVDPSSSENIAEGIKQVFTDRVMQKVLREKGLKQVKKFSWKKTAEETVAVYEEVSRTSEK